MGLQKSQTGTGDQAIGSCYYLDTFLGADATSVRSRIRPGAYVLLVVDNFHWRNKYIVKSKQVIQGHMMIRATKNNQSGQGKALLTWMEYKSEAGEYLGLEQCRKNQCTFPPMVQEGSLLSTPPAAFIACRFFCFLFFDDDGRSDQCEVIPHCSFDLHFLSNY